MARARARVPWGGGGPPGAHEARARVRRERLGDARGRVQHGPANEVSTGAYSAVYSLSEYSAGALMRSARARTALRVLTESLMKLMRSARARMSSHVLNSLACCHVELISVLSR
jgi:hypothetical protein